MTELPAQASPTREFFVYMLTRDIKLHDCILDLVDNSLDGAHRAMGGQPSGDRSKMVYRKFGCSLTFTSKSFEISDNCGGIPLEVARNYAFRFGRDPKAPRDDYGVGLYGIGMKRAAFKIGRHTEVHSNEKKDSFRVVVDVADWLTDKKPEWTFPIITEKSTGPHGTKVVVTSLHPEVAEEFRSKDFAAHLKRILSRDYAFFLEQGFTITLNKERIRPNRYQLRRGEGFEPARIKYRDVSGVDVEIIAGMASTPPDDEGPAEVRASRDMDLSGWYVLCNDRTILAADKTESTVWGYGGIPEWHNQYNGFLGLLFFRSRDPDKLPWTTTKRDVDFASAVYKRALAKMRIFTKAWTGYTNRRKANVPRAKTAERRTKAVEIFSLPTRAKLVMPQAQAMPSSMITISYQRPRAQIEKVRQSLSEEAPLSAREVGEQTFDYYYEREVDG
jgi:hypothetical protein